jgi:hypothetical protein
VSGYEVLPPAQQPEVAAETARPVVDPATLPGPIFGIGTGYSGFAGDRPSPVLTGRLGYAFGEEFGVSLRPTYIFLNRDLQGVDNSDGAFQMPLTLDLFPRAIISPYFGAGIATNTDTNNTTDAMLTGGIDLNLVRHLTLGLNINYIFQSELNDTDWAAIFSLLDISAYFFNANQLLLWPMFRLRPRPQWQLQFDLVARRRSPIAPENLRLALRPGYLPAVIRVAA